MLFRTLFYFIIDTQLIKFIIYFFKKKYYTVNYITSLILQLVKRI